MRIRLRKTPQPAPVRRTGRAFVGAADRYDLMAAMQFNICTLAGLRESHSLLDIGCGSLRAGRLFLVYLARGGYYGIEPEEWLVQAGIDHELGRELVSMKAPTFVYSADFPLTTFGRTFDFLLAQSVFSHASPRQIELCLSQARQVVHEGSIFLATFALGSTDYEGDEWVYPGTVSYRLATVSRWAAEHGFRSRLLRWPHLGPTQRWFAFTPLEWPEPDLSAVDAYAGRPGDEGA